MSPNEVPTFSFVGYFVDRVNFVTGTPAPRTPQETLPPVSTYQLAVNVGAGVDRENLRGQVTLTIRVETDPKWHPYEIEVAVTGRFDSSDATGEQLEAFCQLNGPVILFPYVREIVHRLTSDGMYGVVRLNPVNIQALLAQSPWQSVSPHSESGQLTEQPPSTSPDSKT